MSGNIRPQFSQLAEPPWAYPDIQCGVSVHELISTLTRKRKKAQAGIQCANLLPQSSQARNKSPPQHRKKKVRGWFQRTDPALTSTADLKAVRVPAEDTSLGILFDTVWRLRGRRNEDVCPSLTAEEGVYVADPERDSERGVLVCGH